MRFPDVPTTPAQWNVIAWTTALLLAAMGTAAWYYSSRAAPADAETLRRIAYASFGAAAAVLVFKRIIAVFLN